MIIVPDGRGDPAADAVVLLHLSLNLIASLLQEVVRPRAEEEEEVPFGAIQKGDIELLRTDDGLDNARCNMHEIAELRREEGVEESVDGSVGHELDEASGGNGHGASVLDVAVGDVAVSNRCDNLFTLECDDR